MLPHILQVALLSAVFLSNSARSLLQLNPTICPAVRWDVLSFVYGSFTLNNVVWMIEHQTILNVHSIIIIEFTNIHHNRTVSVSFDAISGDTRDSPIWINIYHDNSGYELHARRLTYEKPMDLYAIWTPNTTDIKYQHLQHIYNFMISKQIPYSITHNNCHHVAHELWMLFTNTQHAIPDITKLQLLQLIQRSTDLMIYDAAYCVDVHKLYTCNRFHWNTNTKCPSRWNDTRWEQYRMKCLQYYPPDEYAPKHIQLKVTKQPTCKLINAVCFW